MTFIKFDLSKFKNACLVRSNLFMTGIKILIFVLICQSLKYFFKLQDFWILPLWLSLTVLIDGFLILKKPKLFEEINLSTDDEREYGLNAEALARYLNFSPKIRLARTIFSTLIVLIFFKSSDWAVALLTILFLGLIILHPILKRVLNIKTPLIFKDCSYKPTESLLELHRNDAYWPGSTAWTAVNSTKQFDNYPKL